MPEAITAQGEWCSACNNTKMDACAGIKAKPALDNPATYDFTLNKTSAAAAGGFAGLSEDASTGAQQDSKLGFPAVESSRRAITWILC